MNFSTKAEDDAVVLQIGGELDALSVPDLRVAMDELLERKPPKVIVDLGNLRLIDSSGVGAIVSLFRRLKNQGGILKVRSVKNQPLEIFRLLKLDRVLMGDAS